MIHRIATILKDRIAAFTYVDKIGGLTRVARQQREGTEIVIPVAGDVDEAYACDPATIRDMVPDDRYGCMVYFEDRGTTRITERTRGTSYRASLRLVCWVNTLKFGSDPTTADRILEQFVNDLNVGQPYNTDTLIGLKHSVEGIPQRGASIFSQYTYPEAARQYLLWPFDAFALDITATYRIKPGCEEAPVPDDDACWTPPVTRKRRNPSEFTCDELTDPVTGLTAEQLGPECLDCEGGGPCEPLGYDLHNTLDKILISGVILDPCGQTLELTAPDAELTFDGQPLLTIPSGVTQDIDCDTVLDAAYVVDGGSVTGSYVITGTLNGRSIYTLDANHSLRYSGTRWELVKPGSDYQAVVGSQTYPWQADWSATPATVTQGTIATVCGGADCNPSIELRVNDGRVFTTLDLDCGLNEYNIKVINEADETVGEYVALKNAIVVPTALTLCQQVTAGTSAEVATCVISSGKRAGVLAELIPTVDTADVLAQVIGPLTPPQDAVVAVTVQLRDSGGTNIGAPDVYTPGTNTTKTAPDGTFRTTNGLTTIAAVRSNGTADAPQTRVPYKDAANADQLTTAEDTVFSGGTLRPDTFIPRITIYESDGVTVQGYTDIGTPFYTVDACPACPVVTKFIWQAGDADTYLWTVTADEAGTYGTYTPTGTNGTLTYSKNGGGYAALSGSITLAVSDTITVRRTTTTNAGSVKWEA